MDARLLISIRVLLHLFESRGHERDEVFQPTHRDMSVLSAV